jgi:glycosyltransferase involved in cell wall biosynthesis
VTCPAEDAAALSDAVLRLKSLSPAELDELGRAGREYYRTNFDADVLAHRFVERLRDMVRSFHETLRSDGAA